MIRKVAMITGGCRGIGLAISQQLMKEGFSLSILGTSRVDKVQAVLDQLRQDGTVLYTSGDMASAGDRCSFLEATLARFGRVDLLVNNAGVAPELRVDLLDMSEESYDRVMTINLKGPLFLSQIVAREMIRQEEQSAMPAGLRGMIINIGSISAEAISLNRAEYCLSKTGLAMATQLFAARLASEAIPVFEIRPGIVETDMTEKVRPRYDEMIEQGVFPIRRWGKPQDLADALSLLISGRLSYSTGECLHVDGGFHIRRL